MKTLVSFTSGMDSAYITRHLLQNTDDEITLMYLNFSDYTTRLGPTQRIPSYHYCQIEINQADAIVEYLSSTIRPIKDLIVVPVTEMAPDENVTVKFARTAANAIKDGTYDRVTGGWNWEQFGAPTGRNFKQHAGMVAAQRAFGQILPGQQMWQPLIDNEIRPKFGRAYCINELPMELQNLTYSCRRIWGGCKTIHTDSKRWCDRCHWDQKIRDFLAESKTPLEIMKWYEEKCRMYPGFWLPIRWWIYYECGVADRNDPKEIEVINTYFEELQKYGAPPHKMYPEEGIWAGIR